MAAAAVENGLSWQPDHLADDTEQPGNRGHRILHTGRHDRSPRPGTTGEQRARARSQTPQHEQPRRGARRARHQWAVARIRMISGLVRLDHIHLRSVGAVTRTALPAQSACMTDSVTGGPAWFPGTRPIGLSRRGPAREARR